MRALLLTTVLALPCFLTACPWWVSCLVEGTLVETPRGPRPIESLQPGDEVISHDLRRGRTVTRKVARVTTSVAFNILSVGTGDARLRGVTAEHPIYDERTQRFVPAGELGRDARLLTLGTSEAAEGTVITRTFNWFPVTVVDLTIDGPEHNFFADGVLVHNKSPIIDCETDVEGGCTGGCPAQERCVDIQSGNLEACIMGQVSSVAADGTMLACQCPLSDMMMQSITALRCDDRGIDSLGGLEEATSLVELDLSNNSIRIPSGLEFLGSLRVLDLSDNPLAALAPLAGLGALNRLDLQRTGINDVRALAEDFSCEGQTELDLRGNPLDRDDNADLAQLIGRGCRVLPESIP